MLVEVDERKGRGVEHFETLCDGFGLVVFADIELAAAFVADALGLRGIVQFVESPEVRLMISSSGTFR